MSLSEEIMHKNCKYTLGLKMHIGIRCTYKWVPQYLYLGYLI